LLGLAQLCVSAGEQGNDERFREAERYLTDALSCSNNRSGSKELDPKERAEAHYLCGYIRVKQYELEPIGTFTRLLALARKDFDNCHSLDGKHVKCQVAREKLKIHRSHRRRDSLVESLGPLAVCVCAALVFALAQVSFFRPLWLHPANPTESLAQL